MRTAAKASLIAVGVVAAVALLSSLVVKLVFDPARFRAEITKLVEEKTGRALRIRGDVELNFFPWLGFKANDIELANAPGFGDQPLAAIDRLKLRVRLLPLLKKELEFGNLAVSGLRLDLLQLADGRTNVQGLVPAPTQGRGRGNGGRNAEAAAGAFVATSLSGLNLKNAQVSWTSRMSGENFVIDGLSVRSGTVRSGEPFEVTWEFDFRDGNSPFSGHFRLATTTALDLERRSITLERTQFQSTLNHSERFASPLALQGKADVFAQLAENRIDFKDLTVELDELKLHGQLTLSDWKQGPHLVGELAAEAFDLPRLLQRFGQPLSPRADPQALRQVSFQCRLDAVPERIRLDNCQARLDDTQLTGNLTLDRSDQGGARFDLELDGIDLDRYGPAEPSPGAPAGTSAAPHSATPQGPAPSAPSSRLVEPLPAQPQRAGLFRLGPATALAATPPKTVVPPETRSPSPGKSAKEPAAPSTPLAGTIKAKALRWRRLEFTDFSTRLVRRADVLEFQALQAGLYDGTLTGSLRLDQGADPGWQTDFRLVGVDLGHLLRNLNPDSRFAAIAKDVQGTLSARGRSREEFKKSLNGRVLLQLTQVKGAGFDLQQAIVNATPILEGKLPKQEKRSTAVGLDRLSAELIIHNGRMELKQLNGESPLVEVKGDGTIDLVADRISIVILAVLQQEQEGNPAAGFLIGVPIPIRINGPVNQPTVSLDLRDVLKNKQEIRQQERKERFDHLLPRELPRPGGLFRR